MKTESKRKSTSKSPNNSNNSKKKSSVSNKNKETKTNTNNNSNNNIITVPKEEKRLTEEQLKKLEETRKARLKKEREIAKEDKKVFEKIFQEAKNNNFRPTTIKNARNANNNNEMTTTIKISEKKAQMILEENGMLDCYKYLITQLCKNGLPEGNLFEYSAYIVKNYEKKWKEKKSQKTKEKIEKYWEEKYKKKQEELATEKDYEKKKY